MRVRESERERERRRWQIQISVSDLSLSLSLSQSDVLLPLLHRLSLPCFSSLPLRLPLSNSDPSSVLAALRRSYLRVLLHIDQPRAHSIGGRLAELVSRHIQNLQSQRDSVAALKVLEQDLRAGG